LTTYTKYITENFWSSVKNICCVLDPNIGGNIIRINVFIVLDGASSPYFKFYFSRKRMYTN